MRTTTNFNLTILENGDMLDYNPTMELLDNLIFNLMNRVTELEAKLNQFEPTIRTERPRRYIRPQEDMT